MILKRVDIISSKHSNHSHFVRSEVGRARVTPACVRWHGVVAGHGTGYGRGNCYRGC